MSAQMSSRNRFQVPGEWLRAIERDGKLTPLNVAIAEPDIDVPFYAEVFRRLPISDLEYERPSRTAALAARCRMQATHDKYERRVILARRRIAALEREIERLQHG